MAIDYANKQLSNRASFSFIWIETCAFEEEQEEQEEEENKQKHESKQTTD